MYSFNWTACHYHTQRLCSESRHVMRFINCRNVVVVVVVVNHLFRLPCMQTEKSKAEARLTALSEAGFDIDDYLAVANTEPFTPEEEEPPTPTSTGTPATNTSTSSHRAVSVTKSDSTSGKVACRCWHLEGINKGQYSGPAYVGNWNTGAALYSSSHIEHLYYYLHERKEVMLLWWSVCQFMSVWKICLKSYERISGHF